MPPAHKKFVQFKMEEHIEYQLLIAETFDKMQHQIDNNLDELREKREIYAKSSIDALRILWHYFNDNNKLLQDAAPSKDDKYFTDEMYDKIKKEYLSVIAVLRQYARDAAESPEEDSPSNLKYLSQLDLHIHHQRLRFTTLQEEIKSMSSVRVTKETVKSEARKMLKNQWITIEKCHKTIRDRFPGMWPDLSYELDYVQYKNMYETTYFLVDFKKHARLFSMCRLIATAKPKWRMFGSCAIPSVHQFIRSHFDLMRKHIKPEGKRRKLLIVTLVNVQYSNDIDPNAQILRYVPFRRELVPVRARR